MKKAIAILLMLCMLLGMLASCQEEETPAGTQEKETFASEELSDNLPEMNMNGFELRFYTNNPDVFTWGEITITPEEDVSGVELYDEMYERNAYIEERFKCTITATQHQKSALINTTEIQNFVFKNANIIIDARQAKIKLSISINTEMTSGLANAK